MDIAVLGLNHKTAPVSVRERLAFDPHAAAVALKALKARYPAAEFVILSTCNRVEIYWAADEQGSPSAGEITAFLAERAIRPPKSSRTFTAARPTPSRTCSPSAPASTAWSSANLRLSPRS